MLSAAKYQHLLNVLGGFTAWEVIPLRIPSLQCCFLVASVVEAAFLLCSAANQSLHEHQVQIACYRAIVSYSVCMPRRPLDCPLRSENFGHHQMGP